MRDPTEMPDDMGARGWAWPDKEWDAKDAKEDPAVLLLPMIAGDGSAQKPPLEGLGLKSLSGLLGLCVRVFRENILVFCVTTGAAPKDARFAADLSELNLLSSSTHWDKISSINSPCMMPPCMCSSTRKSGQRAVFSNMHDKSPRDTNPHTPCPRLYQSLRSNSLSLSSRSRRYPI